MHSDYKQNKTNKSKAHPSQPLPTPPSIIVGQVRVVVVVVVNQCTLSLLISPKIEPKKVNYNHEPPEQWLCVNAHCRTIKTPHVAQKHTPTTRTD